MLLSGPVLALEDGRRYGGLAIEKRERRDGGFGIEMMERRGACFEMEKRDTRDSGFGMEMMERRGSPAFRSLTGGSQIRNCKFQFQFQIRNYKFQWQSIYINTPFSNRDTIMLEVLFMVETGTTSQLTSC